MAILVSRRTFQNNTLSDLVLQFQRVLISKEIVDNLVLTTVFINWPSEKFSKASVLSTDNSSFVLTKG